MKKYKEYYDNTQNNPPNKNLKFFITNINQATGTAIDLGCGAGRDTVYLIKNGWNVLAVDQNDVEERIVDRLTSEELNKFRFSRQQFEAINLEETDLLVSNFSLSFCDKDKFYELWSKIKNSIKTSRIFYRKLFRN